MKHAERQVDLHAFLYKLNEHSIEHTTQSGGVGYDNASYNTSSNFEHSMTYGITLFILFLEDDWHIININAAYFDDRICYAGIANHKTCRTLQWFGKEPAASPIRAETKVALRARKIAHDRNWRNLLIPTDCQLIPSFIWHNADWPWEIDSVIRDIILC